MAHAGEPYDPPCDGRPSTDVPGGRTCVDQSESLADIDADRPWYFVVMFEGDDGRIAIAKVAGATVKSAQQASSFTEAQLAELVQDPTLTFPDPN